MNSNWLAPHRTALLLIDMQRDFAADDGAMAKRGADLSAIHPAVAKAERLADAARAAGVQLVFVRLLTPRGCETPTLKEWQVRRGQEGDDPLCETGTRGADFVGPQPQDGDMVVTKARYSAFTGTELAARLRARSIDTLVLAGVTTECCIDTSARDAFEQDFHVIIATDAVAAYETHLHDAALRALEINLATLVDSVTIQAGWK